MSGIYIHIPFCKQACHYCDFHFSTSMKMKTPLVQALIKEIDLRADYLKSRALQTIYLGGGTPSLLNAQELNLIFKKIFDTFWVEENAEITLEANPDDLTPEKLAMLKDTPINRLSIGIQSFQEQDLKFMNRAHNAREAINCINLAKKAGFEDLTIDLIYGTPTMNNQQWKENIEQVLAFDIPHISCYCLTIEERTALAHFVATGKAQDVDEDQASDQFGILIDALTHNGYEHYEISNFAKPGRYARHNSAYWRGVPYLGIGPSAHSFNGHSRQWNVANNIRYIKALEKNELPFEIEHLSEAQLYNEYIMTGLRTRWGVELDKIPLAFQERFLKESQIFISNGKMVMENNNFRLTQSGKFQADLIASTLFWED